MHDSRLAAIAVICRRHVYAVSGNPWQKSTTGPSPCSSDAQGNAIRSNVIFFESELTVPPGRAGPSAVTAEQLGKLKQVTPRIGKECDAKPHRNDVVWLGNDGHRARLQLLDGSIDARHAKTHVMPSCQPVAVMQILECGPTVSAGPRQKLEDETIVAGGN